MLALNKKPYAQKVIESLGQEELPALPTANGTYTLKLTVLNGVNTFSWVVD